ncbi:uncharacterized protein DS421_9g271510 [Arachis hypogaea]|nr:uncharacterized protein DS421_9g271510 [Arachis hypogaea]
MRKPDVSRLIVMWCVIFEFCWQPVAMFLPKHLPRDHLALSKIKLGMLNFHVPKLARDCGR